MDATKIRLLVADDHPLTREGLAMILDNQPDMAVVAQANNGAEAVELYRRERPDVALLDLQMPVMNGVAAIEAVVGEFRGARVVVLTTYDGDEDIYRAMHAGAKAYLLKDSPKDEVLRAIRTVHAGGRFLLAEVGARLADRLGTADLTEREREVLRLVADGRANKQIAHELGISEGTVKSHVNGVMSKLGAASRTDAALIALRRGLLRL